MSTLVLAMALSTVSAHAPDGISSEVEQTLYLPGSWQVCLHLRSIPRPFAWTVSQKGPRVAVEGPGLFVRRMDPAFDIPWHLIDEGHGRLRIDDDDAIGLGIYRWHQGHLVICFRRPGKPRPTSFHEGDGRLLFTLRRVK